MRCPSPPIRVGNLAFANTAGSEGQVQGIECRL